MSASTVFYGLIFFITAEFVIEKFLDWLNAQHFEDPLPAELQDVFDNAEYQKSQAYKKENYRFQSLISTLSFLAILFILFFNGFGRLDQLVSQWTENNMLQTLYFFGLLLIAGSLFNLPFSYYHTFVIEEKYGFNQSSKKLFFTDQIKSLLLTLIIGGLLLTAFVWFYQIAGHQFWLYAWILLSAFSIFINMFYTSLIVPLFNKLTPLKESELRQKLKKLAQKTSYNLHQIYVIDGSKRSSKANAYFSGFGPKKKVVLYDTLIKDLSPDEISAVLAHEIGHYKKKHIIFNLLLSILTSGILLYLLSLVIDNPNLAKALGAEEPKFHIGLIAFTLLFTPVSFILGIFTNWLSRKFEYQADAFARKYDSADTLISGLKKLSQKSLSNLTPHPWYVFVHYSHPHLLQRIRQLKK